MTRRASRLFAFAVMLVLVIAAAAAFRCAGPALVRIDPPAKADAIIILGAARMDRTLEAGQLYREGWAPRVVVLRTADLNRRGVLARLGIKLPTFFDLQVSALEQMGVPRQAIVELRETVDSTADEARAIRAYARSQRLSRIIVVTSTYHTRRARHYLRALAPDVTIILRNSRYDGANPQRWWRGSVDRIDVISEYAKWPKAVMVTSGRSR